MWDVTQISTEQAHQLRRRYEPLTDSVRQLVDAVLACELDDEVAASLRARIDEVTATLRDHGRAGPLSVCVTSDGETINWGNAGDGPRNALAPPLRIHRDSPTRAHVDIDLGAAYEGAPGHLHGGYGALVLDHLLGFVASRGSVETVAATGTITLRYGRPTRLGALHAEAEIQRTEGRKIFLAGRISDDRGVTVDAEAVYITLAREA
jgi:acyl-coenzyme A thioesterase PaaI-like protein